MSFSFLRRTTLTQISNILTFRRFPQIRSLSSETKIKELEETKTKELEELKLKHKKYEKRLSTTLLFGVLGTLTSTSLEIFPLIPMIPFYYTYYRCTLLEDKIKSLTGK